MTCPKCNSDVLNDAKVCKFCGADLSAQKAEIGQQTAPNVPEIAYEMKWFKFLIYFLLFADAALRTINGIMMITGGVSRGGMYEAYAFLQPVDIVFGIIVFGLAALCVYTRFQLSGFRKNSPKLFYALNALMTFFSVAYDIIYLVVVSLEANKIFVSDIVDIGVTLISTAVYIFLNAIYFDRRKHLFEGEGEQ